MIVYVELVLFNNLAVDFAICIATQLLRYRKISAARAIVAAVLGAIAACLYAIAPKSVMLAIKLLLAPIMSLLVTKFEGKGLRHRIVDYICTLICFCLLTYFVGGMVYGISYALGIDLSRYALLGVVACAVVVCLLSVYAIARKRAARACIKGVKLVVEGHSTTLQGLCDSGNLLVDEVSGLPVAIISSRAASSLNNAKRVGTICVNTVGGESCMELIKPDCVYVDGRRQSALCAISEQSFLDYDVILQNSMF